MKGFIENFVIYLNSDSHLLVDLTEDTNTRKIELLKGQAHFDVKKDPRPFEVFAGDRRILALGTSFNIKLDSGHGVMITLVEGDLEVEKINRKPSGERDEIARLKAGEQLIIKPNATPVILTADLDATLTW